MHRGFARIYRSILNAPFYGDHKAFRLAIYLLLKVNHFKKEMLIGGAVITIQPGQTLTSIEVLQQQTGLTPMVIRGALARLKKCHFLTSKTTNQYTLLTICKHESYNKEETGNNKQNNKRLTNGQQTTNKRVTTNNKDKPYKPDKKKGERDLKTETEKTSFSLHNFKNSKDQTEINFYILFKDYPKQTFGQKAFELFKAQIKTQEDYNALYATIEHYYATPECEDGIVFNLENFMKNWKAMYDGLEQEAEEREEHHKQREADLEAEEKKEKEKKDQEDKARQKRIAANPDRDKSFDQTLKEMNPGLHKQMHAVRAGKEMKKKGKTASIKKKTKPVTKKKGG
ncbi:hypothetical protein ES703_85494 [subsurface metagenome]